MASIESVRASIDANIKTNGRQEITGVVMNAVLNNMVDLSEKNEGTLEEQKTLLNEQSRQIDSLEQKKANEDGKYPELTAGFANNLVGRGEAVDATINFRPSGGTSIEDGAARVKELKGNSIVWNQLAKPRMSTSENGVTVTHNGNTISVKGTLTSALNYDQFYITQYITFRRDGRKYLVDVVGKNLKPFGIVGYGVGNTSGFIWAGNLGSDWGAFIAVYLKVGESIDMEANVLVVDLTQMFGAGNEPTTIEEFYNRIPQNVDLYAYNEGEVIHTNAEGIKSVGFNAWDEEWEVGGIGSGENFPTSDNIRSKNFCRCIGGASYYCRQPSNKVFIFWYDSEKKYISYSEGYSVVAPTNAEYFKITDRGGATYNGGICINLAHSGYRNGEYQPYMQFIRDLDPRIKEAFPNGMMIYDKVYDRNSKGCIVKRTGVQRFKELEWIYSDGYFVAILRGAQIGGYGSGAVCGRYASYKGGFLSMGNKMIVVGDATFSSTPFVIIKDTAFADVDNFRASFSEDDVFYYELETPEVTEYDEPFNLDYEVWDFGTEQMIATEPSAPIKASIVYGFNAVDSVRTAQLEIAELKKQIAQMQAIMASMTAQPEMIKE